jgi:hypothetical protein
MVRILCVRLCTTIVHQISHRQIRPLRLSGALRWSGASESAQLWNQVVLIASQLNDIVLGNTWNSRVNFGANLDPLDPTEELIFCTLQLWGLVVSQLQPGYGASGHGGHGGHGEVDEEEEDGGVDVVPVRSGAGDVEDGESSEEENEEEYFMLDPTLQLGAVRPIYPMATQHVIQLSLHVIQWYLSTSDEGEGECFCFFFFPTLL